VTSAVTINEVYKRLKPVQGESAALQAIVHLRATTLVPFDDQLALEVEEFSLSSRLNFSDATAYATARRSGAELHTSDPDLRGIPGAIFHQAARRTQRSKSDRSTLRSNGPCPSRASAGGP
jgi:predicted nucleic acid-binding protein